jgi:hypothetical protein
MVRIAALQKEYEVLMTRYQEAVQTHIADLQQSAQQPPAQTADGQQPPAQGGAWVALPGRAWWGDAALTEGPADSRQQCEALCAAQGAKCTGATFNARKRYCWTRSGEAQVAPGSSRGDVALLRKATQSLVAMEALSDRLLRLNQEIQQAWTEGAPRMQRQATALADQRRRLADSYLALKRQQADMRQQLAEYSTADASRENSQLMVQQQYAWLRLGWGVAAVSAAVALRYWLAASPAAAT